MSKKKGDILEDLIAELHRVPGVSVTRNARLASFTGNGKGRGRDIDVLVEADVAGYDVQLAIECKNERGKIGAPKIDAFAGKLIEVGIPTRHGIFVSTSGFTVDALRSAAIHRIRPLVLTGLTLDGLRDAVGKALCSTVYLLCDVVHYTIANRAPNPSLPELNFLYANGQHEGLVLDRFAQLWTQEKISSFLGKHSVDLPLTPGTYQVVAGEKVEVLGITAEVEVVGLVLQLSGRAVQHALIDPLTKVVHKFRATVVPSFPLSTRLPLAVVRTDEDVRRLCMPDDASSVISRVRLPRIRYGPAYWPLSRRALAKMRQAAEAFQRGMGPNPSKLTFRDIEGDDLAEIFES